MDPLILFGPQLWMGHPIQNDGFGWIDPNLENAKLGTFGRRNQGSSDIVYRQSPLNDVRQSLISVPEGADFCVFDIWVDPSKSIVLDGVAHPKLGSQTDEMIHRFGWPSWHRAIVLDGYDWRRSEFRHRNG